MKHLLRSFAAVIFVLVGLSLNSSASSLLCQTGPVTINGSAQLVTMYTCAIPANAVASGKSLRITASLWSSSLVNSYIILNGTGVLSAAPASGAHIYQFVLARTGTTTGSMGGLMPGASVNTFAPVAIANTGVTLPWGTGWTLQVQVSANTGVTVFGDLFTVEILN